MTDPPSLPYEDPSGQRTMGWSGSDTSRERALREARDGTATARQRYVMDLVTASRREGMTWEEVAQATSWHHGSVSGLLSVLHQHGRLARLKLRRGASLIYVAPGYVDDRPLSPYRRNRNAATFRKLSHDEREALRRIKRKIDIRVRERSSLACLDVDDLRTLLDLIAEAIADASEDAHA